MRKSFLFNVFFMVFVNLLIKPLWVFGIDRTVQNQLGESDYGMYFAIFNFTYLFQILLDFGFQNYNNREVAADNSKINTLLPNIVFFKSALFIIYLIVCVAVAYPLGYLSKPYIWIILCSQVLLSFTIYLRSNVSAHQMFITDAFLSVLDKLLMIIFCGLLIWGNISGWHLTVFNFALAQLAAYTITFFICLFFSLRLTTALVFDFNFQTFIAVAKATLPYAVIHFLMTTYYRVDGVMLEQLKGNTGALESGIYAQGYRIMEALNNIGYLFATILLPLFTYKLTQRQEIKSLLKSSLSIMYCISVSLIILMFWYRNDIIQLLYISSNTSYSAEVFGYLLLNFFPVAILYVIGTLLTANQNFRLMIITLLIAVVLNISLNYYLITHFGAKGAGQATLITQLFMLSCYTVYCIKYFHINANGTYLLQLFSFAVCCFITVYLMSNMQFSILKSYDLLIHFILYLLLIPIFAFLTQLITKKTLQLKIGGHL